MRKQEPIVLIGNGGGALAAARALRESRYRGEIHLVSDGLGPTCNPMLFPYYLSGKIPLEACRPYGSDFALHRSLELRMSLGSPVVELDAGEQFVRTARGTKIPYDRCLIASGASAKMPRSLEGRRERVLPLRTPADALALRELLVGGARRALVVGASMIGVHMADILNTAGVQVTLADLAPNIFPTAAHPDCARLMEAQLRRQGIRLRLSASLEGAEALSAGRVLVYFEAGERVAYDFVLVAAGIRPNVGFVDHDQIRIDQGIVVDEGMRSSASNLFAAGDAAVATRRPTDPRQRSPSWSNAVQGGRTAGRNMAGGASLHPGTVPANLSRFCGLEFVNIGDVFEGDTTTTLTGASTYIRLVWKRDRLRGANLINCQGVGMVRRAIAKEITYPAPGRDFLRDLRRDNPCAREMD